MPPQMMKSSNEVSEAIMAFKHAFFTVAFFSLIINTLMLTPSIYMMQVYDRVLVSRNETTLMMLTLIVLGLYVLMSLLEAVRKGIALLGKFADLYAAKVKAPMDALTNAITGCLEELTKVITNAITPQKVLGDLKANLTKIKLAAKDLLRALNGLADFAGPTTKRDADTANYAILVISKEAYRIAANMAEREQELARLDTPDVQAQVVITDGVTLRDIAQRFYNSAADWIFIANFNSLPCSPPTGTVVLVPYRAT